MEAVIVAGGLGSRLRPLTDRHPKHLLPVAGVPFLAHQLSRLAVAGVRHVVLATSYRAEEFRPAFGDGSALGLRLTYVTEDVPLGTGGAVRQAADHLEGGLDPRAAPVLVLNGDQLADHDLTAQLGALETSGADLCLHLVQVPDPRAYGCVPTDATGRVTAFLEKSPDPVTRQVNAGCYVFTRSAMAAIPAGRVVSLERETFPHLLAAGRYVLGFRDDGYWLDVGTPETLVRASADLVTGAVRSPALTAAPADRLVDRTAVVDPSAVLDGGSAVGPAVVVGPAAVVTGSVLMAGARVGAGARIAGSALGPGAQVGERAVLAGGVLGDGARVMAGVTLPTGTRVGCDSGWP